MKKRNSVHILCSFEILYLGKKNRKRISRIRHFFQNFRRDLISRMVIIQSFRGIKFRGFSRKWAKSAKFNPREIQSF